MTHTLKTWGQWPLAQPILVSTLLGLGLALLGVLLSAAYLLPASMSDLRHLAIFMLASSLPSLALGYLIFFLGQRYLKNLYTKIVLSCSVGTGIVLVNIYVTSRLMFFNPHDLTLLTLLLMFAAVISLPFALSFAAVISQAVNAVKTNAEKLAGGDLSTRVQVQAHQQDEIGELARSFNMMADHLQEAFQRQIELEQTRRDLIAAVSHDLRTPLASVRVMSEALVDKVVTDPETVERYHRTIQAQVTNLASLIDDLFELAKLDNAKLELKLEPGNMLDLISDTLEVMRVQAAAKNIRLDGRVEAELPAVLMEERKIQRVLYNLIQNAIRHTPADGSIFITAAPTPAGVAVSVADTGEGIAEADLALIFNEFYRGEKSRNRSTGGAGLGLAIVKRIVEAHGGCVSVQSQVEQGTVFRFELPKWSPTMGGG